MNPMNISSTTGRRPVAAEPTPAPMKADSVIGVSITRSRPNRSAKPLVTPRTPPQASKCSSLSLWGAPLTSSPNNTTFASRSISIARASLIASR